MNYSHLLPHIKCPYEAEGSVKTMRLCSLKDDVNFGIEYTKRYSLIGNCFCFLVFFKYTIKTGGTDGHIISRVLRKVQRKIELKIFLINFNRDDDLAMFLS